MRPTSGAGPPLPPASMEPVRVALLGPPGAGKSTQAAAVAERLGVAHLSTGDLLRAEAGAPTPRGREIARHLARGALVPDELVVPVLAERLATAPGGFVLDGFPRDLVQAEALAASGEPLDAVVLLDLPEVLARARVAGRAGDRGDDRDPDAVERRFRTFHDRTEPVAERYRRGEVLTVVDAAARPELVTAAVLDALPRPDAEGRGMGGPPPERPLG